MASSAPTVPKLTRRDKALLAAVAAGRCHLTKGPLPRLLVDWRGACDQLAVYQLLANGYIRASKEMDGDLARAELTSIGRAVVRGTEQEL